ncbi:ATP-dependent DNA helicase RecG [Candidatus Saganbacteria bacterium]|nr:ATP-dependent DNA helicase RecG [Candidatus Saganbacteria bacterium]
MISGKLQNPVQYLKGVGPALANILSKIGIFSIEDLIYYFPYEYEDRSVATRIGSIKCPQDRIVIKGEITHVEKQQTKNRFSILKVTLNDKTGDIKAVFFNQPFLDRQFKPGVKLIITGRSEMNHFQGGLQVIPKEWELDTGKTLAIVPIYHLTESLYAKTLRKIISNAIDLHLNDITDVIPGSILKKYGLQNIQESIKNLHFPKDLNNIGTYKNRIIFEDLFLFQLGLGMRKKDFSRGKCIQFKIKHEIIDAFPIDFELTRAQNKVLSDIFSDLSSGLSMHRLLQGDVGSGKTVVAALACFAVIKNGFQAAVLAPTEILAQQHFEKMSKWFKTHKVRLLTGTSQRAAKKAVPAGRQEYLDDDLVIGTHALIEDKIKFNKLGIAVIDEQHRFGVLQRSALKEKGINPHFLFMTATPIPRSLALTLYGDLDRSIIDEMPPGRTPVKTHFVPNQKRKNSYDFMRSKISEGQQIFIVCPLVSESETLDLKAAVDEAELLQKEIFPEFIVGLVHGKMKPKDKDEVMEQFRNKKIHILVSTTVIEVGIDIPNASIMVIEHSERFGLSQLHQLRGRVGRGQNESYCFLMGDPKTPEAKTRIKAMINTNDGFKIAEADLKLRGPGDFYGARQSGLPEFHMADIIRDENTLDIARNEAFEFIKTDPNLANSPELKAKLFKRYGKFLGY